MSKTQARAIMGTLTLVAGSALLLVGAIIMAAWGLGKTGALSKAADAAAVVPGAGKVAAGLSVAQSRATRGGGQAGQQARQQATRKGP